MLLKRNAKDAGKEIKSISPTGIMSTSEEKLPFANQPF